MLLLSVWALWYHYLAGLRHLYWDTGKGLEIKTAEKLGMACIGGSLVLTLPHRHHHLKGRPMRFITARKRAEGMGAAHHGTDRHWYMIVSAVGLAVLIPIFVYIVGNAIGEGRERVLEIFSHPFNAILSGLVLFFGMRHFAEGSTMMIEDYWQGVPRRLLVICAQSFAYGVAAIGLFALAKIAL